MKRANLVLDERLLQEAQRVLQTRTLSATINLALAEVVRIRRVQSLPQHFGSNLWEGDLAAMRRDRTFKPRAAAAGQRSRR